VHQEIVLGAPEQRFFLDPPDRPRGPASVVVTSHTGTVQTATTGDCALDLHATTVTELAAAGTIALRVASTLGITPGTPYDVVAVDGDRIRVVATRVVDATTVALRRPLVRAVPPPAQLAGCRIAVQVDPAWAADVANVTEHLDVDAGYVLAWSYGGASARTTADLVRTPQRAQVTPDDVERRFPGWHALLADAFAPTDAIAEALDLVHRDVRAHRTIRRARDAAALRELAIIRAHAVAVEHAVMFRGVPYAELVAADGRYQSRLAVLVHDASVRPVVPQSPQPPSVADPPPQEFSVAHANVIEAMMEWVGRNPLTDVENFLQFEKLWPPRLRTPDERQVAAMFLRAQSPRLPKGLRKRFSRLIENLSRRS
jgi:hypothetical protein